MALVAVLCLALGLTGCASTASLFASMTMNDVNKWPTNDQKYEQDQKDFGIDKMTEMAKDGGTTLYFNEKTTEVAVKTEDGSVWYSNPQDRTSFNQNRLGNYSSQLLVTTIGTTTETVTEENNFEESVQYGQFQVEKQDKGFKIQYLFGKKQNVPLYPQAMTVEKFDEILATLSKSDQYKFKKYYSLVDIKTVDDPQTKAVIAEKYLNAEELGQIRVLKTSPSTIEKKNVLKYLESAGFTMEDREAQLEAVGYVDQEGVTNYYTVTMVYTLKDGRLVVDVPTEEIKTSGGVIIQGITVLPHWNTLDGMKTSEMLLPDGSGAIVKLGETAASGTSVYQEKFYGRDFAQSQKTNTSEKKNLFFPMYGLSNKDGAMYATVTGSDATAYMLVDPCTSATAPGYGGFYFQLVDTEQVRMSAEDTKTVTTYANKAILDPIQVDFTFLPKTATSWVDIAASYKARLESEGKLSEKTETVDKMPVSVEFLGAIDDIKTVVGVPTEYIKPLTTFDQAKDLTKELAGMFPNNQLIVQYDAWSKGGVKSVIQSKVKTEKKVGTAAGLKDLAKTVEEAGGLFYPLADTQYIYRNRLFDGFTTTSGASRGILREAAFKADFNVSNFMADEDGFYGYLLAPAKQKATMTSFLDSYKNTVGAKTVGLTYVASDLSGDYSRDNFVTRTTAKDEMAKTLAEAAKEYSILSRGANAYALSSIDVASQIPMTSNAHPIIAYSVPFTQMILSGAVTYTADVWNNEADTDYYVLQCIETGSVPDFTAIASDNSDVKYTKYDQYYAVTFSTIKDSIQTVTDTVTEALSEVYGEKMVGYDRLSNNAVAVTYENGNGVVVNYGKTAFASPYGDVEAGSYLKFTAKGGDAQ